MLVEVTRAMIAMIAALAAFVAPFLMLTAVLLGYAELNQALEIIKTWLAFIGPFAGIVIGYYFHRESALRERDTGRSATVVRDQRER